MNRFFLHCFGHLLLASLFVSLNTYAQNHESGTTPVKRTMEYSWMSVATWDKSHAEDTIVAQYDKVDVLFIGDSITAGWDWNLWQKYFVPLNSANFGIGGDHTGNLLWRLQHGAIGNIQPKLIVLLIGVNNLEHLQETPQQAALGITNVITQLQLAWPNSKILLNAVFPYQQSAQAPERKKVKDINKLMVKLADNKKIIFKDYGSLMLQKDGSISPDIMADFLHPTPKGYQIWADTMTPDILSLLK